MVWCLACSTADRQVGGSNLPVVHDWINKGLGMSSRVCATGHIQDPVTLVEKSRTLCPGGRFPSFSY